MVRPVNRFYYDILKRETDTNHQIYEAMLQKVKEAGIASAMRSSNYKVVDPAKPPGGPYKPNPRQSATMGSLGGLVLGVLFVLVRERADRSLQQPGDVGHYLNLPELGVIPSDRAGSAARLYGGSTDFRFSDFDSHTRCDRAGRSVSNLPAEAVSDGRVFP